MSDILRAATPLFMILTVGIITIFSIIKSDKLTPEQSSNISNIIFGLVTGAAGLATPVRNANNNEIEK